MLPDFSFAAWRPLLPGISFWALAFYLPLCLPLARLEEGLAAGSLNGPLREGLLLVAGVALALLVGLLSAVIFWLYLVMLYRFAPNDDGLRWRSAVLGALVGVVGWLIVANLFRLYVDHIGSYNRVYGSLGVVVIFLVFLYLTGLTVLIGGETSAELHDRRLADRTRDPVAPAFP